MNKNDALKKITQAVVEFRTEMNLSFDEGSSEPATIGDIAELAKQTYYALHDIEKALSELIK